jgi:hypothetical protein
MALLWILLGAALVVAVTIFHAMNPQPVDINLYGYPIFGVPLWMLVGFPALAGLALGILMDVPDRVRSAWQGRRLTGLIRQRDKQIADLETRITALDRDLAAARAAHAATADVATSQPPVIIEEIHHRPTELPRAA